MSALKAANTDDAIVESTVGPYFSLLESLYEEELPLAKAIEASDLLVHVEGPAVGGNSPRVSLVTALISDVKSQIGQVTKAIASISGALEQGRRLPRDIDLGLAAFAKGSLYIGFSLPDPASLFDGDGTPSLLGEEDPLYRSTKEALRCIGIVVRHVTAPTYDPAALGREIPDLLVRDTALTAVRKLSPSKRRGTSSVSLGGLAFAQDRMMGLSLETREVLKTALTHPVTAVEHAEVVGTVREIDLDARRFELRQIFGASFQEIRCAYSEEFDDEAKTWLDKLVQVHGRVEKDSGGRIRMLEIESLASADKQKPEIGEPA
jgi:hypothetical protein